MNPEQKIIQQTQVATEKEETTTSPDSFAKNLKTYHSRALNE